MIVGIENAIKFVKLNGHIGFRIKNDQQGQNFIFSSESGESLDKAIARFREIMEIYEGSGAKFYLEAWPKDDAKQGWSKDWFKLDAESAAPASAISGPPVIQGISEKQLEERIAGIRREISAEYELKKLQEELSELKDENKELTRRHESAWEQLVQRASPYIGYILQAVVPKTAQVGLAGVEPAPPIFNPVEGIYQLRPEDQEEEKQEEEMEKEAITNEELTAIIAELEELEPEFLRILHGALHFVKENRMAYKTMVRPEIMKYLCLTN
jgi:hypothetical protein